jgi:putative DNA primase/helicase
MTDNSQLINIRQAVEERSRQEEESEQKTKPDQTPDSDFVIKCLRKNELGDGELFKRLYSDRFIFNKAADSWMEWNGQQWIMDTMNNASAAVEGVVRLYEQEAIRLSKEIGKMESENIELSKGKSKPSDPLSELRKELNNRIHNLRTVAKRQNCLTFAHTSENPLSIKGDEIDKKPWMLPCKNGVINLKTGELEVGKQKDFLLKSSPVSWRGIEEPCPVWEQTLLEIFSDNQEVVDCFQRVCGYAMIGKVIQSLLIVMTGKGRNGKSLLVETISKTLGPLACAIRSEMLLDQGRVSNPSGPSPDIMSLRGLRMAFASETDDGCKISPSRVKWLTGNDTITGRNPHDKHDVSFKPSHTLFLLTNHKPHAPAEDFAFWERVILFPFKLSYVDRPPRTDDERRADSKLPEKLEEELSGILTWMVRGCLAWQEMGVSPPKAILDAATDYQREEDSIADFIEECCIIGERYSVGASEVYSVFEKWWVINVSKNVPKQKRFGLWFAKRFEREKKQTVRYLGVTLLEPSNIQSKF